MHKLELTINGYFYRIERSENDIYWVSKQSATSPYNVIETRNYFVRDADKAIAYFTALINERTVEVEKVG